MNGWRQITCASYEALRKQPGMRVHSACTNYVGGHVLDAALPPYSFISYYDPTIGPDETLRSYIDADGCRHYSAAPPPIHIRRIRRDGPDTWRTRGYKVTCDHHPNWRAYGSTPPIALKGAATHWDRSHTRHGDTP